MNSLKFLKIYNHNCATVSLQNGFCSTLNASILWNISASVFSNCHFDLTDGVKIQELAVNAYFGNNVIMVILLKNRIEYLFAHNLLIQTYKPQKKKKKEQKRKEKKERNRERKTEKSPLWWNAFARCLLLSYQKKVKC